MIGVEDVRERRRVEKMVQLQHGCILFWSGGEISRSGGGCEVFGDSVHSTGAESATQN